MLSKGHRGPISMTANWFGARHQFSKFNAWLIYPGSVLLLPVVGVYIANGFVIGWANTYEVTLGAKMPHDTSHPVPAWILSVTGWLLVPAVVGTIAAALVSATYESYRKRTLQEALRMTARGGS